MPFFTSECEVKEEGERCSCNGEIDCLYLIQRNPDIYAGKCFQCRKDFTVIKRLYDGGNNAEL